MSYVIQFFEWLYGCLKKSVEFVVSVPGMMTAGVVSLIATLSSIFSGFIGWTSIIQWLGYATSFVQSVFQYGNNSVFSVCLEFLAIDTFVLVSVEVLLATIGATAFLFTSVFVSFVLFMSSLAVVRFTIKLIHLISLGFADV